MSPEVKKLVSVLATSTPVIETRAETVEATQPIKTAEAIGTAKVNEDGDENEGEYPNLTRIPCIRYPITFRKKSVPLLALFNSGSEVNAIYPTFARELGLSIRTTNIGAQKIDGTMLNTFRMVVVAFSMTNKANQVKFFEETFLVANSSLEIVLEMSFLTLSGADVNFSGRELRWKAYTPRRPSRLSNALS